MERQISCEFNIDTACVEVKYADGSMISIDCTRVENEVARNMYEANELDWLVYNAPVDYVNLLLNGDMREYLKNVTAPQFILGLFTFLSFRLFCVTLCFPFAEFPLTFLGFVICNDVGKNATGDCFNSVWWMPELFTGFFLRAKFSNFPPVQYEIFKVQLWMCG